MRTGGQQTVNLGGTGQVPATMSPGKMLNIYGTGRDGAIWQAALSIRAHARNKNEPAAVHAVVRRASAGSFRDACDSCRRPCDSTNVVDGRADGGARAKKEGSGAGAGWRGGHPTLYRPVVRRVEIFSFREKSLDFWDLWDFARVPFAGRRAWV